MNSLLRNLKILITKDPEFYNKVRALMNDYEQSCKDIDRQEQLNGTIQPMREEV